MHTVGNDSQQHDHSGSRIKSSRLFAMCCCCWNALGYYDAASFITLTSRCHENIVANNNTKPNSAHKWLDDDTVVYSKSGAPCGCNQCKHKGVPNRQREIGYRLLWLQLNCHANTKQLAKVKHVENRRDQFRQLLVVSECDRKKKWSVALFCWGLELWQSAQPAH